VDERLTHEEAIDRITLVTASKQAA